MCRGCSNTVAVLDGMRKRNPWALYHLLTPEHRNAITTVPTRIETIR